MKKLTKYNFITTGITSHSALKACEFLKKEENIDCGITHFSTIKPLDKNLLKKIISKSKKIISIEENLKSGGFGSSILEFYSELKNLNNRPEISIMGIDDIFIQKYGTQQELFDFYGLSYKDISKK